MNSNKSTSSSKHGSGRKDPTHKFVGRPKDYKAFVARKDREADKKANQGELPCHAVVNAVAETVYGVHASLKQVPEEDILKAIADAIKVNASACKRGQKCNFAYRPPKSLENRSKFIQAVIDGHAECARRARIAESKTWTKAIDAGTWKLVRLVGASTAPDGAVSYRKHRDGTEYFIVLDGDVGDWCEEVKLPAGATESWCIACSAQDVSKVPAPAQRLLWFLSRLTGGRTCKASYTDVRSKRFWNVKLTVPASSVLRAIYGEKGGKVIKPTPSPREDPQAVKVTTFVTESNHMKLMALLFDEDGDAVDEDGSAPAPDAVDDEDEHIPVATAKPLQGAWVKGAPSERPDIHPASVEDDDGDEPTSPPASEDVPNESDHEEVPDNWDDDL